MSSGTIVIDTQINAESIEKGVSKIKQIAEDAIKNLSTIGIDITPVLSQYKEGFDNVLGTIEEISNITKAGFDLGGSIQEGVNLFTDAKDRVGEYLDGLANGESTQKDFNQGLSLFEGIVGVLTGQMSISTLATTLYTQAQTALNTAFKANPIGFVVTAIMLLIGAFLYLWNTNEGFRTAMIAAWNFIKEAAISVWNYICDLFTVQIPAWIGIVIAFFQGLGAKIGAAFEQVMGYIIKFGLDAWNFVTVKIPEIIGCVLSWFARLGIDIWQSLCDVIAKIGSWLGSMYQSVAEKIPEIIGCVLNWFGGLGSNIWKCLCDVISKISSWISSMYQSVMEKIPQIIDGVINFFKSLPQNMLSIGRDIINGLWNGISNGISWFMGKIKEFTSGIVGGIKKALGIHSPSTVFRDEIGKNMALGLGEGFESELQKIYSKMQQAVYVETGKMQANVMTSGTYYLASQDNKNLNSNIVINTELNVDGEKMANNTAKHFKRQQLQYGY